MKVRVIDYFDVWGNCNDGWEINNMCHNEHVTKNKLQDKYAIIRFLKAYGYIKSGLKTVSFDIDDYSYDNIILINVSETSSVYKEERGKPLYAIEILD